MSRTEITFSFETTLDDFLGDLRQKDPLPEEELRDILRGIRNLLSLRTVVIGDDLYKLVKISDEDFMEEMFGSDGRERIVIQRKSADDPWEVAE